MNYIFCDLDCTIVDTIAAAHSVGFGAGRTFDEAWEILALQPDRLVAACAVYPVLHMVRNLSTIDDKVVLLTNRRQSLEAPTRRWMERYDLRFALHMRPDGVTLRSGEFKAAVIKTLTWPSDSVTMIDDDPDGSVQVECNKNGWTLLKVVTYKPGASR